MRPSSRLILPPFRHRNEADFDAASWIATNASHWWSSTSIAASMQTWVDEIEGDGLILGTTTSVQSSDPTVNTAASPSRLEFDGVDDRLFQGTVPASVQDLAAADTYTIIAHFIAQADRDNLSHVLALAQGSSDLAGIITTSGTDYSVTYNGNAASYVTATMTAPSNGDRVLLAMEISGEELFAISMTNGAGYERSSGASISGAGSVTVNRISSGVNWFGANPINHDLMDVILLPGVAVDEATFRGLDAYLGSQ